MAGFLDNVLNGLNRFHQWTKDTKLPTGGSIHDQPGVHEGLSAAINGVKDAQTRHANAEGAIQRQFDSIPNADLMARMGFKVPPNGGSVT